MKDSPHDMSASWVKLDLDTLVAVAAVAVKNARANMDRQLAEVDRRVGQDDYNRNHHSQFYAQYVAEAAQEYADAWRTFHALNEARSRSDGEGRRDFEIIIVRKPHDKA